MGFVTLRILCKFVSEIVFILFPIAAIIAIKVHDPSYHGSILSEKEWPLASILLCGSAIRLRYMLSYKQIGQRLIEDLFFMDILIILLTASCLLFSFVALASRDLNFIEPAQMTMFLVSLVLVYLVCLVEEKQHQYLRKQPDRKQLSMFFRVLRGEMVQVESAVDDCALTVLGLTADLLSSPYSGSATEDLKMEITVDHLQNLVVRFEVIQRRSQKACEHLNELEKSIKHFQMRQMENT